MAMVDREYLKFLIFFIGKSACRVMMTIMCRKLRPFIAVSTHHFSRHYLSCNILYLSSWWIELKSIDYSFYLFSLNIEILHDISSLISRGKKNSFANKTIAWRQEWNSLSIAVLPTFVPLVVN